MLRDGLAVGGMLDAHELIRSARCDDLAIRGNCDAADRRVVRDGQRLAVVVVFERLRIDAQGRESSVKDRADVGAVVLHERALVVRRADDAAGLHATASHRDAPRFGPLMRGVRPNSLMAMTSVCSSSPVAQTRAAARKGRALENGRRIGGGGP